MSRRRGSYRPYQAPDRSAYITAYYGDRQIPDPRDLTAVPAPPDPYDWLDGLKALAQGVAGAAVVIGAWHVVAWWLGL